MQLSHYSIRNHELHRRLRIPPSTANLQQNIAFRLKDLETVAAHGNRNQSPMLRKFPLRRVIHSMLVSRIAREDCPAPSCSCRKKTSRWPTYGVPPVCNMVQTGRRQPIGKSRVCLMSCRQLGKTSSKHTILLRYRQCCDPDLANAILPLPPVETGTWDSSANGGGRDKDSDRCRHSADHRVAGSCAAAHTALRNGYRADWELSPKSTVPLASPRGR